MANQPLETIETIRDLIGQDKYLQARESHLRARAQERRLASRTARELAETIREIRVRRQQISARLTRWDTDLVTAIGRLIELEAYRQDCTAGEGVWFQADQDELEALEQRIQDLLPFADIAREH